MVSINHWAQIQNEEREWETCAWFSSSSGSFFQRCGEHLVSKPRKIQSRQPKLLVLPHPYKAGTLRRDEILAFNGMLGNHLTEPDTLLVQ